MLKTLLKKQMAEIFQSYLYDAKKNRKRSKASTIMFIVMYVFIMVGILGGIFTYLAIAICKPFSDVGIGWLYFALMGLIAIALGSFGSVFNTFSGLYLSKDNDLMLSLPIPVRYLLVSRLLSVYLMGLMYAAVVIVPAVIVYWVVTPVTALSVIGSVLLVALISVIVLILSCLLGWVVAKASLKLKNKSFVTVLLSLLFIGAYYFLYFKAQTLIGELISNAAAYGEKIKGAAYPVYLFGQVGTGSIFALLVWTAVVAILFAAVWIVLSRSFIGIVTATGKTERAVYREKTAKAKSVFGALLFKEWKRFTSSPNYMLNCGLGTLIIFICGIGLLIKGNTLVSTLDQVFGAESGCTAVLLCAVLCMAASMNDMAAPSVSLEGKNLWIVQSLPADAWKALCAKLSVQILMTGIPVLFCAVCMTIILQAEPLLVILLILLPLLYTVFSALFGLYLGLKMPNLTWTNEIAPIKQSMCVTIALFGGWGYTAVLGVVYLVCGYRIGPVLYLAIAAILTALLCGALYSWLRKKGTEVFENL